MIAAKPSRSAGSLALFLASTVTLVLLAFHPQIGPHSSAQLVHLFADVDLGMQGALVHGALIVVLGLLLYGVMDLAKELGLRGTPVAFGLLAYALGCAAVMAAMLFDGFITSQLAVVLLEKTRAPDAPATILQAAPAVFALVSVTIQVFTKAGFCGMGVGMCFLSCCGFSRSRTFGWLGLVGGLLPALVTAASGIWLRPHQLIVITGCQAIWYLGAAMFLLRQRSASHGD